MFKPLRYFSPRLTKPLAFVSSAKRASLSSWGLLFLAVQVFWAVTVPPILAQDTSKSPLVVIGDKDYSPYEALVDGEPVGINVDLWQELAKILGRPLDMRLYQWADAQARVQRGEAKVLSFMSINKERAELYDFTTQSTFTSKFPVFVLVEIIDKFDISDLQGKRIAVKKGGFPRTILENVHPEAVMVFVDSALEGFRMLLRGEVDGVVEDERVGYNILRQNHFQGIVATPKALSVKTGHIAVVKGNPALLRQIEEAVEALKSSGKFDQIMDRWAHLDVVLIKKETLRFVIVSGLVAIVLIISLGGVVYVLRMRRTNLVLRQEIIERKRVEGALRESEERFRSVVNNSPTKIHIKDTEGRYLLLNSEAEKLFGVTEEEARGKTAHEIFPDKQADDFRAHDQAVLETGQTIAEEEKWALDDGVYTYLTVKFPIRDVDGEIVAIGAIGTDITERKREEEEIHKLNEDLDQRVQERTADLRAAHADLLRKERMATLGQLTATISHELRNPLGVIQTSTFVVRDNLKDCDPRVGRSLERIERSVIRCDRIIDELLDYTRIRKLEPEPTPIDTWLGGVLKEQTLHTDITLRRELGLAGVTVFLDHDRFRRAVINVFDNACQAMVGDGSGKIEEGEHILTIQTGKTNGRIEVVFEDNGPGIPPDVLPRIFEPMFSTKGFGVGLGMPIVKQIMEQHGGGIEIETEEGRGTKVRLWLDPKAWTEGVAA